MIAWLKRVWRAYIKAVKANEPRYVDVVIEDAVVLTDQDYALVKDHGRMFFILGPENNAELAALLAAARAQGAASTEDIQPYKDALNDLVQLKAQADIGCVPSPTKAQWDKAWSEAEELTRVEP